MDEEVDGETGDDKSVRNWGSNWDTNGNLKGGIKGGLRVPVQGNGQKQAKGTGRGRGGGAKAKKEEKDSRGPRLAIGLNLDLELELKARIVGDITLSLMLVLPFLSHFRVPFVLPFPFCSSPLNGVLRHHDI